MKKEDKLTYKEALARLELLVQKIESPETPLEDISEEVKKALELVKYCRELIRGYQQESASLLEQKD